MLVSIGGTVIEISSEAEIRNHLISILPSIVSGRIVDETHKSQNNTPHSFQNVDVTILRAEFGVAENGALWVTDDAMPDRVLPFICSHLAIIVTAASIVPTLHHAYEKIGLAKYEFGTFIAGPSKTADIEQSLVLGAHGAKTMTCFLIR
jgi:L-lactate dehydrogenase complex protein LldG